MSDNNADQIERYIYHYHNAFYRWMYNTVHYTLELQSNKHREIINSFLIMLDEYCGMESIGIDWIDRYYRFQWNYWLEKDLKREVQLGWIIGKKAFQRYIEVTNWEQVDFWIHQKTQAIPKLSQENDQILADEFDLQNQARLKYHNTEQGFAWCIENTSLYVKSAICLRCRFNKKCRELLKVNYPSLYNRRMRK